MMKPYFYLVNLPTHYFSKDFKISIIFLLKQTIIGFIMKQAKFFLFLMLSFCCVQATQLTAQSLDLSVEQETAFKATNKAHQLDVMTIQKDETLTNEEKRLKIDASKSKYEADIKDIMNEEQYAKWIGKRVERGRKKGEIRVRPAIVGSDKCLGKDEVGHDIYQGPKGGQYYVVEGSKQYLDKIERIKFRAKLEQDAIGSPAPFKTPQPVTSLINTTWVLKDVERKYISILLTLEENGRALLGFSNWEGTNYILEWSGNMSTIKIWGEIPNAKYLFQGNLNSGILDLSSSSDNTVDKKIAFSTQRYDVTKLEYVPINSKQAIRYTPPPVRPATKTVELTLKGIFMSPCNEGVAGYVEVDLRDKTTGYTIRSREGTRSLYKNPRYSLSCPVYDPGGYADGLPSHVLRGDGAESPRPETQGSNVQQRLSYTVDATKWKNKQYEFKIRFTLGSQHRDNFMAALGNHWLATGQNRIEEILPCDFSHTTIGPYVTPTNRQHEYCLQFSTNAY